MRGICKLTGTEGKFVKAHILPKALTRPGMRGAPFIQGGQGSRLVRRWSSWYDDHLVTEDGERILTELDTWAISDLRKHRLVWSSPSLPKPDAAANYFALSSGSHGIRIIDGINPRKLRLFFLSLLWRAAASDLREFSEIELPPADIEKLKAMLISGDPSPTAFYPIQLVQLSTKGFVHNLGPFAWEKKIGERTIPMYRFYLDGLIAHIWRQSTDDGHTSGFGPLFVGQKDKLVVITIAFEDSFQAENVMRGVIDAGPPRHLSGRR